MIELSFVGVVSVRISFIPSLKPVTVKGSSCSVVKLEIYGIAALYFGSQLPVRLPLSLWWERTHHHPGTHGQYKVRVTIVYFPQVSPGSHSSINAKKRMNSWMDCAPIVQAEIPTQALVNLPSN